MEEEEACMEANCPPTAPCLWSEQDGAQCEYKLDELDKVAMDEDQDCMEANRHPSAICL